MQPKVAEKETSLRSESVQITQDEYNRFSEFLRAACGINLGDNKQYLVSTRIRRILMDHQLTTLNELTEKIRNDSERGLRQLVIDAMTTNETFWFRDLYPYKHLAEVILPEFARSNPGKPIRIWSAACSTGQEPYSISMIVEEGQQGSVGKRVCDAEILATDVSSRALESARRGVYERISVTRGLSEERMQKFFTPDDKSSWRIKPALQRRVRFRPANLQESYYLMGKFDVIFCRNVLIYFSMDLKTDILTKMHGALNPGGILFLGSSETITGVNHLFEMVSCKPGVAYRRI